MTNDVLKRLRSSEYEVVCPCGDLRKAAADEIEQLRLERHQLRNELTAARLALEHLTNGYKFPAECCRIAREGLAGAAVEPRAAPPEMRYSPVLERASTQPHGWVADMEQDPKGMWTPVKSAFEPKPPRADQWTPEQMAEFQGRQAASLCQGCFRPVSACVCTSMKSSAPLSHIADCQCKNPWTDTFYEVGKCPLHGSRTAE